MRTYEDEGTVFATVENFCDFKHGLSFAGTRQHYLQIGKFRYDAGHVMKDHRHITRPRKSFLTQEALVVFQGSVEARVYNDSDTEPRDVIRLVPGDIFTLYTGGVGFTVLEDDTIMAEFKNGPYDVTSDDEDRELI